MIPLIQSAQQNHSAKNILQTDSVKQNHSEEWFCQAESFCSYSPQKNSNPKSWDLYIWCSIYKSQLFGLLFFGENESRMILLDRMILQNILSRNILLCRMSLQNILSRMILHNIFSAEWFCSEYSADWFCQAESFCSYSPPQNSNSKSWDLYIWCSIYKSQLFGLLFFGENKSRMFLLNRIILQNNLSRMILLFRLSQQNILSKMILQNILNRMILLRILYRLILSRVILSSRIILFFIDSVGENQLILLNSTIFNIFESETSTIFILFLFPLILITFI